MVKIDGIEHGFSKGQEVTDPALVEALAGDNNFTGAPEEKEIKKPESKKKPKEGGDE